MMMVRARAFGVGFVLAGVASMALDVREASACGGVFVSQSETYTLVTDHRMAIALSRDQTVVWDQIRYVGNPREFAWVAPVRPGARLELSTDAWFEALEASTEPVVFAPPDYGGAAGCALAGCGNDNAQTDRGTVEVVRASLVGPYEQVTIRANDPGGVPQWLRDRGFFVPDAVAPAIGAYADEGYEFIALRLRPECGTSAMRPIRIISQGFDPTIALRMMSAGASREIGITLWVIAEARYAPQSYPSATIDYSKLVWERSNNRSNYDSLADEAMGSGGGKAWITEYADTPPLKASVPLREQRTVTPTLFDVYPTLCANGTPKGVSVGQPKPNSGSPCTSIADAGVVPDAAPRDAGSDADAGAISDADVDANLDGGDDAQADAQSPTDAAAGSDAAPARDGGAIFTPTGCGTPDDLAIALRGIPADRVYVTRLRASLPSLGLATSPDLKLAPSTDQSFVSNSVQVVGYSDDVRREEPNRSAMCGSGRRRGGSGEAGVVALSVAAALWWRRRRR
jgi:hypothetical protein